MTSLSGRVTRGLAWSGAASAFVGLLDLVGNVVVLAFWIAPAEYGTAVLALMWFPVLDVLADGGLGAALIQGDEPGDERLARVFWMNLLLALGTIGLVALAAPAWARLHRAPVVAPMLLVYSGKLLLHSTYLVPQALLRRELRFREMAIVRAGANAGELAAKIGLAAAGWGVWCFVVARLVSTVIGAILTQVQRPWRPRGRPRLSGGAEDARFGLRLSASQLLFHFYTNVDYAVVHLWFGAAATGLYRLAYEMVLDPVRMLAAVVNDVAFPAFARLRGAGAALADQLVSFTRLNMVVMLPLLAVVALEAGDLLGVGWGPDWVAAAPAAQILVGVGLLRSLSTTMPPLLDGLSRPELTLRYMAVNAVVLPVGLVVTAQLLGARVGWIAVPIGWALAYPVAFAVLAAMALRAVALSWRVYLRRVRGVAFCAAAATAVAAAGRLIARTLPGWARLAIVTVGFVATFLLLLARREGITPARLRRDLQA